MKVGPNSPAPGGFYPNSNCREPRRRTEASAYLDACLDQKVVVACFRGMSPNKEYYRARAEECCRMAIMIEDTRRRAHWLEAAVRWISLGREQGVLLPRRTRQETRVRINSPAAAHC